MTAETVLQDVLMEVGLDIPAAQLSSSRYDIGQIRTFMNAAGQDIARRAEWSRLYADFTVAGGVSSVALPYDFHEMAERGAVRLGGSDYGYRPVRGIVAPEQWEFLKARPSIQPYYHLRGGNLLFSPALPEDGAFVRYVSSQWVYGADAITQNGDTLKIPERLVQKGTVWRWKRQNGMAYDDILAEFEADLVSEIKADRGEA